MAGPALVWFRDDFRLSDNPALTAGVESGVPLLFFAVLDESSPGLRHLGGAARWWLHGSLQALGDALTALGAELLLLQGPAEALVARLAQATGASALYWNRRYTAAEIAVDSAIKTKLTADGVAVRTFNGRLLHEPWEITNRSGRPFQVFTPYLRAVVGQPVPRPLPSPVKIHSGAWPACVDDFPPRSLADLRLEPSRPDWAKGFAALWARGEAAARRRLDDFLDESLQGYARGRDFPGAAGTSRLSPHLRFGEISPRQVWHAVTARGAGLESDAQKFLAEVAWRDFCHQLLYLHPHLPSAPHADRFHKDLQSSA